MTGHNPGGEIYAAGATHSLPILSSQISIREAESMILGSPIAIKCGLSNYDVCRSDQPPYALIAMA